MGFFILVGKWLEFTDKTQARPELQTRGHDNLSQSCITYQKEVQGYKISLKKLESFWCTL